MVKPIELPPQYYRAHFFELLDVLDSLYRPVFEKRHVSFINDFRSLSQDAQCVYIRMVNRKGQIFSRSAFSQYKEIQYPKQAIEELKRQQFIKNLSESDKMEIAEFFTKPQLGQWLVSCGIKIKKSLSKKNLLLWAQENKMQLDINYIAGSSELLVQARREELGYLLFLYFGKIQTSLNLYTLRDLGIRKTNETKNFTKPRYSVLSEAQADFFFAKTLSQLNQIKTISEIESIVEVCRGFSNLKSQTKKLKNSLYLNLAEKIQNEDSDLCLSILNQCTEHPAREKICRILFKNERKDECRQLLDEICKHPLCDEELLFAEDFLSRKFKHKKIGYLTEALKEAKIISLSDAYFKKPEQGICDLYRSQGIQAYFTENHLWNGLFGLLFWEELFEKDSAALFSPFDRSPSDLVGSDFYENNKCELEKKLRLLQDLKSTKRHLLKMLSLYHGKLNNIFTWHPDLIKICFDFLEAAIEKNVAHILRTMACQYELYHIGYPDLMVIQNRNARFIEVKAEGDSLGSRQLSKVRLLIESGFNVDILRVKWEADPNQIYVVVDVETTGGNAEFHRVTEIGAVKVRGGEILEEFQTLINPGRPIPKFITQITGISNEMVADAPKFSEIAEKFFEFTKGAIFVAHNARFDYGFIQREFQRLDQNFVRPHMCTVQSMRKSYPGLQSYSLKHLTEYFRITLDQHHRALCDAKAATELLFLINGKRTPGPTNFRRV